MDELEKLREEKNKVFASDPQSPLTPEQKMNFDGLRYFPENHFLRFEQAVDFFANQETIKMQTSSGSLQSFLKVGLFKFSVESQPAVLTLYRGEEGEYFLPFKDALAGKETYAAGRYVEPISLGENLFMIDFNFAYNPYCAYNDRWTCPLPPAENRLAIPIRAGEKIYQDH